MEEKGKAGFSLRKGKNSRRPEAAAPRTGAPNGKPYGQLPSRPNGDDDRSGPRPQQRPKAGGNTSDLVKRRYSSRFTQGAVPDFNKFDGAPAVPRIPNIPSQFGPNGPEKGAAAIAQDLSVDLRALKDSQLEPEKYATRILSDASEQDIAAYQKNLRKVKTRASTDLQHNVYQNRTQFIKISKEAEKLKGEMRMLRGLMSELTNSLATASMSSALAPGLREPSLEDGSARARKKANRSSVANLEAMWTTHLHSMWKNIEGSQKYLPAIPGRHIVHETGNWVELDAATWKPRRPVHIVLLNDHLLVATRKRKKIDPNLANANQKAPTKLVAERCWTLQEIDMLDLAASATLPNGARGMKEISNAVSIRRNNESFTYRSDKPDSTAKTNLFLAFRRTMDELRRMERSEGEEASNKNKETLDYLSARDPAISDNSSLLRSLSKSKDRPEVMIDVDGKQRNLRWVEGQVDELDIEIALQRFDEAVKHVERLRRLARGLKNNEMAQDLITAKVDERARKLADLVTQRLVDTHSALHATQTNISWLVRLNYEDRARESYLRARTAILTKRSRQCIFEGDLQQYITEISFVYFTLLKNTVSIYQQCFPPLMMSACVKWAKEHLDALNGVLKRQLGSVARGSEVVKECLERAREHAAMMGEVGLGFRDLVGVELLEEVGS